MWRGRYQLGQEAVIGLLTVDANGTPTFPDAAPAVQVFAPDGTLVYSGQVPVLDRFNATGLFQHRLYLGGEFNTGLYRAVYAYTISGAPFQAFDTFEVLGGGDPAGAVTSLVWHHRPHGEFVLQQTSGGSVVLGRNPRV